MTANVVCIKWGTLYGPEYVNRLYQGVLTHLKRKFRFVCLTDNSSGIHPEVEIHPLPETPFDESLFDARKGGATWRKVGLFQPGLAKLKGDSLFLDLDVVITESLDPFFEYCPGKFCVIHDWLEKRRAWLPGRDGRVGNTSVFRYNLGQHSQAYSLLAMNQELEMSKFRIEQQYVSHALRNFMEFWPAEWVQSFKRSCRRTFPLNHLLEPKKPEGVRILVFHGHPLPDQAIAGYQAGLWRSTLPAPWLKDYWIDAPRIAIDAPRIAEEKTTVRRAA